MSEPPPNSPNPSIFSFARIAGGIVAVIVVFFCGGGVLDWVDHRKRDRSIEAQNDVKNLALAVTNYVISKGAFPPHGEAAAPDAPPVSWMTALLPFMDQRALHRSIDFDQPFDAPANAAAFSTVVRSYTSPHVGDDLLPSGLAPAHYAGNVEVFVPDLTFDDIGLADGVTNTLMLAEVNAETGAPTAWGDPANLRSAAAPVNGPTGFGANRSGVIVVAFADGRATILNADIDPAVFAALGTPDGGEDLDDEW